MDTSHTYGHEKIEFFSSGLKALLILVAAGGIGWCAVARLLDPRELQTLDLGVLLTFAASLINFVVAQCLFRVAQRRCRDYSIIFEAGRQAFLMTDVWNVALENRGRADPGAVSPAGIFSITGTGVDLWPFTLPLRPRGICWFVPSTA